MSARTALFALVSIGFMPVAWCVEDATRPSAEGKLQQALKEYREALSRCNKKEVPSPEDLTDLSEAAKNLATQQKQAAKLGLRLPGASIIPKSTESPRLGGKTENVFAKLKSLRLSLSQAPDEDAKPARFSYTQDFNKGGQGAEFNSAFYLRYFPSTWLGPQNETNEFAISVQAKLSSSDAKSIDSWRFRAEDHLTKGVRLTNSAEETTFALNVAVKEESDRDFRSARVGGEAWITATDQRWLMGIGTIGATGNEGQDTKPAQLPWFSPRWVWSAYTLGFLTLEFQNGFFCVRTRTSSHQAPTAPKEGHRFGSRCCASHDNRLETFATKRRKTRTTERIFREGIKA